MGSVRNFCKHQCIIILQKKMLWDHIYWSIVDLIMGHEGLEAMFQASILALSF